MKVYLAARYEENGRMRDWRDVLVGHGIVVTSRWIDGGHEDMTESRFAAYAEEDLLDVEQADALVMLSDREHFRTGRGGRHVEVGYALARGKRVILVGDRENVFHWLCETAPNILIATTMLAEARKKNAPASAEQPHREAAS